MTFMKTSRLKFRLIHNMNLIEDRGSLDLLGRNAFDLDCYVEDLI